MAVFKNDPFECIWTAFNNLYPDKDCECYLTEDIPDECYGCTDFPSDGSTPIVWVSGSLSVLNASEILAHELAHVAVSPNAVHGDEWRKAFDNIHAEYDRLMNERFE